MTTEPMATSGPSSQTIASSEKPAAPRSPTFRIVKGIGIALWAFCALVLPCFLPFIQPEPAHWWKLAMIILPVLSWLALYVGLYAAVLDNAEAGSPQAKFAKTLIAPALMSLLGHKHDAS